MLLSENSKISTPSIYTVFSWTLLLELWNPWRQQVASIHTVFTQDLELHLPMEGELLWPFCTISQGQCILRGQLGAVFPPLPCYYAVSMAGGSNRNCTSCSCMVSAYLDVSASLGRPILCLLFCHLSSCVGSQLVFLVSRGEAGDLIQVVYPLASILHWLSGLHGIVREFCPGIGKVVQHFPFGCYVVVLVDICHDWEKSAGGAMNAGKALKWKWKLLSHVQGSATPWTAACQAPLSMEFSRPQYQSA